MTQANIVAIPSNLSERLRQLDKKLNLLLEELKYYSEDQLNRSSGEDKWSVIQIMHHLILAETKSCQYLEKKLSFNPKLKSAGVLAWVRKLALRFFLWSPIKWKAPKGISGEHLPDRAGFWDTAKQWKEQRDHLKNYLATLPPETFKKEAYKHPRAGRMSIYGMVDSFHWHFDRHHQQIRQIVKYFPKQN